MTITQKLAERQEQVEDARVQLNRLQDALERTDSALGVTDDALIGAQELARQTRRVAPAVGIGIAVTAAVVVAVVVVRRRRRRRG